jgi:hypothetical protein
MIAPQDLDLFAYIDTAEEAWAIIERNGIGREGQQQDPRPR